MPNLGLAPMTRTSKILLEILCIAGFISITAWFWSTNSVNCSIDGIKDDIVGIIKSSLKKAPDNKDSVKMGKLKATLSTNINIKAGAKGVNDLIDTFMARWKGPLPRADIGRFTDAIDQKFETIEGPHKNLESNQTWAILLINVIFIIWLLLVANTNLLRDTVGDPAKIDAAAIQRALAGNTAVKIRPPFSLARTQLAFWIAFIACIYIYAVLWDQHEIGVINHTALILMGISAGTSVSAGIIDTQEIASGIPRSQDEASKDFFTDILSDGNGISIHRFQNVVWTFVAIIIYIYRYNNPDSTGHDSVLPELDSTLLALTGISSATYLVLKTRENIPTNADTIPQIKITLAPDISLAQADKDAINNSANGFDSARVQLTDATGTNKVPAAFVPGSKFDFIAKDVKLGVFQKVTATWTGTLATPGVTKTLTGNIDGMIDNKTPTQLNIGMK